jgi:helicase MOV-10
VRSSREFVEYDLQHTLGFVANPRRFNGMSFSNLSPVIAQLTSNPLVAVTRAQALLIVVGDAEVLALDPLWRAFLNYVHTNGGWAGPAMRWDATEPVRERGGYDREVRDLGLADMNEFTRRMEAMTLGGVTEVVEEAEVNVDRPWRELD